MPVLPVQPSIVLSPPLRLQPEPLPARAAASPPVPVGLPQPDLPRQLPAVAEASQEVELSPQINLPASPPSSPALLLCEISGLFPGEIVPPRHGEPLAPGASGRGLAINWVFQTELETPRRAL